MFITGANKFPTAREQVWNLIINPAVLQKVMPGCQKLEPVGELGEETYAFQITVAVSGLRSSYKGKVQIVDKQAPERLRLSIDGSGLTGRLEARAELTLAARGEETEVQHQWDVRVEGPLRALGEPALNGVGRWFINEFFKGLQAELERNRTPLEP